MSSFLITSDWHFGQSEILGWERGDKFNTIQEHDEYIVELVQKWIEKLDINDTFYFLGDFGRPTRDILKRLRNIFKDAKCLTIAICGNHDGIKEQFQLMELFDRVESYPIWISPRIVLSHMPVAVWKDQLNICGHLHGSILDSPNYINANIHVAKYHPINTSNIDIALSKISKYNRRFLYEPWADMYKFTQKKSDVIYDKDRKIDLSASRFLKYFHEQQPCESE